MSSERRPARVLVIGDVMLDKTIHGQSDRLSPEGPVPVVLQQSIDYSPGGAANVAANVNALGGQAAIVGLVGQDDDGRTLCSALAGHGVNTSGLIQTQFLTTVKTRIYAGRHLAARFDREQRVEAPGAVVDQVAANVSCWKPDVIVLSDYGKGALAPRVILEVIILARKLKLPIIVDPKGDDFSPYAGATVIKPNLVEAWRAGRDRLPPAYYSVPDDLFSLGEYIRDRHTIENVLITAGPAGMVWAGAGDQLLYQPAFNPQAMYDVTGAGDTVAAALAVCIGEHLSVPRYLEFAACAAGLAVGKPGTATVKRQEVDDALNNEYCPFEHKIFTSLASANVWAVEQRTRGRKIVLTNGCFDLLHPGHHRLLRYARSCGDQLIVAVNSDASVKRLKGEDRPIVPQQQRLLMLASLEMVDGVVLMEDDPTPLVEKLRPDVLVKGADHKDLEVKGAALVESWGGSVKFAPDFPAWRTTSLLEKIQPEKLEETFA